MTLASDALAGRLIGVTGGAGHLGTAITGSLARAGAYVLVLDQSSEALDRLGSELSGVRARIELVHADISSIDEVEAALGDRVLAGWVNNAYAGAGGKLLELNRADVERSIQSGLVDVIMLTQWAAKRMIAAQVKGAIVNISSMYGVVSPDPSTYDDHPRFHNPPAYGAAKAGVGQFTRYAACHLATHGIRVNAVCPGPFPSPAVQQHESFIAELDKRAPLGRIGQPPEVGEAVAFLFSSGASYITGHELRVDGGWTAW